MTIFFYTKDKLILIEREEEYEQGMIVDWYHGRIIDIMENFKYYSTSTEEYRIYCDSNYTSVDKDKYLLFEG